MLAGFLLLQLLGFFFLLPFCCPYLMEKSHSVHSLTDVLLESQSVTSVSHSSSSDVFYEKKVGSKDTVSLLLDNPINTNEIKFLLKTSSNLEIFQDK